MVNIKGNILNKEGINLVGVNVQLKDQNSEKGLQETVSTKDGYSFEVKVGFRGYVQVLDQVVDTTKIFFGWTNVFAEYQVNICDVSVRSVTFDELDLNMDGVITLNEAITEIKAQKTKILLLEESILNTRDLFWKLLRIVMEK